MGDLKYRVKKTYSFDKEFINWIEERSKKTGTPVSRILELSTIEMYKEEYNEFIKKNREVEEND